MSGMEEQLARVDVYLQDVQSLPTLPEMLGRLSRVLEDPNAKIGEIADLILKDQALTANLLRLVNSSFFARHRQITNIREAVVFLGFRPLRNLIVTTMLMGAFRWQYRTLSARKFWEHSLATAIVARQIAEQIGFEDLDNAYLSGLVHDLGIVVISQYLPKQMEEIVNKIESETSSLYEAEKAVLGVGHTSFGAWLGKRWSFQEELVEVMFYHEEPSDEAKHAPLVALVSLADMFCRSRGLGYGITEYWCTVVQDHNAWRILKQASPALLETDWEKFQMDLKSRAEEIRGIVMSMFKPAKDSVTAQ